MGQRAVFPVNEVEVTLHMQAPHLDGNQRLRGELQSAQGGGNDRNSQVGCDAAEYQTVWGMLGTPLLASSPESFFPSKEDKLSPLA